MIDPEKYASQHNAQQCDAVLGYLSRCYFRAPIFATVLRDFGFSKRVRFAGIRFKLQFIMTD
jgi:hypothetical protein